MLLLTRAIKPEAELQKTKARLVHSETFPEPWTSLFWWALLPTWWVCGLNSTSTMTSTVLRSGALCGASYVLMPRGIIAILTLYICTPWLWAKHASKCLCIRFILKKYFKLSTLQKGLTPIWLYIAPSQQNPVLLLFGRVWLSEWLLCSPCLLTGSVFFSALSYLGCVYFGFALTKMQTHCVGLKLVGPLGACEVTAGLLPNQMSLLCGTRVCLPLSLSY